MFFQIVFLFSFAAFQSTAIVTTNLTAEIFLKKYGYMPAQLVRAKRSTEYLSEAIKKYQTFYRLQVTGKLNDETATHMNSLRCGNADFYLSATALTGSRYLPESLAPRLTKRNFSWKITEYPSGMDTDDVVTATRNAMKMWSDVCNIDFYQTTSYDVDIELKFQFPNSHNYQCSADFTDDVLAHYVAGSRDPSKTHYNDRNNWKVHPYGNDQKINLVAVIAHEIGHVLTFAHTDVRNSIMYASYDAGVNELSWDDIAACTGRYGTRDSTSDDTDAFATTRNPWEDPDESTRYPWEDLSETTMNPWEDLSETTMNPWEDLSETTMNPWEDLSDTTRNPWEDISETTMNPWEDLSDTTRNPWEDHYETTMNPWEDISETTMNPWEDLSDTTRNPWEDISETTMNPWEDLSDTTRNPWEDHYETTMNPWEDISETTMNPWEDLPDTTRNPWGDLYETESSPTSDDSDDIYSSRRKRRVQELFSGRKWTEKHRQTLKALKQQRER